MKLQISHTRSRSPSWVWSPCFVLITGNA